MGKGFVLVLIPVNCVKVIEMLSTHQSKNGIATVNQFVQRYVCSNMSTEKSTACSKQK